MINFNEVFNVNNSAVYEIHYGNDFLLVIKCAITLPNINFQSLIVSGRIVSRG